MNTTKEAFLSLIASDKAFYEPILEKAKNESEKLICGFFDSRELIAGWGHDFVCMHCGAKLVFDMSLKDPRGKSFSCSLCKKEARGERLERAWVFYMRHYSSLYLRSVAACAVLGDEKAKSFLESYLDFYAENYKYFEIHGEHGTNNGRLLGQILDESVWASHVAFALYSCRSLFSKEKTAYWYEHLFEPLIKLINVPADGRVFIHNHILWHKCAVGAVALAFDKGDLLRHALDDASGIRQQLEMGLSKDNFWFECSSSYHYYAMLALGEFCAVFANEHPRDEVNSIFSSAMLTPLKLSHDGRHLPSLNDGWYPIEVDKYAELFFYAYAAKPRDEIAAVIGEIEERNPRAFQTPLALFFPKPTKGKKPFFELLAKDTAELLSGTCLAVLREPVFAVLKSGVLEEWHKHSDMLSLILPPFSDDLGTCAYGHPLYEGYYTKAVSHNTVTVDLKQPKEVLKTHVERTENGVRAIIDDSWEGVLSAERSLTVSGGALVDETKIKASGVHTIDWLLHFDGETALSSLKGKEASLGEENGYEYLSEVREIFPDELDFEVKKDGNVLRVLIPCKGLRVFIAKAPSNPAIETRATVVLRKTASEACFLAKYFKG